LTVVPKRDDWEGGSGVLVLAFARSSCIIARMASVTQILGAMSEGDPKTPEELLPLVYEELRRLAAHKMASEPHQTLQATALVHEAWLRLAQESRPDWKNRQQFFAVAAEVMRRILVDRARRRRAKKHGGDQERIDIAGLELPFAPGDDLVLQMHDALERLAAEDPDKAQVVKLRFFAGLANAETAALLGVSEKTVQRHWAFAKAWLARAIEEENQPPLSDPGR